MARPLDFIIFGVPRSGTKALVRGLNLHPHVYCAQERFHFGTDHSRLVFPDSFLDASTARDTEDLGKIEAIAEGITGKDVRHAGNKLPRYYFALDRINREVPGLKNIWIYRSPYGFIPSWNRREQGAMAGRIKGPSKRNSAAKDGSASATETRLLRWPLPEHEKELLEALRVGELDSLMEQGRGLMLSEIAGPLRDYLDAVTPILPRAIDRAFMPCGDRAVTTSAANTSKGIGLSCHSSAGAPRDQRGSPGSSTSAPMTGSRRSTSSASGSSGSGRPSLEAWEATILYSLSWSAPEPLFDRARDIPHPV